MKTTPEQLRDFAVELMDTALNYLTKVEIKFMKREGDAQISVTFYIEDNYNFTLDMYLFYEYDKNESIKDKCMEYIRTNHFADRLKENVLCSCEIYAEL